MRALLLLAAAATGLGHLAPSEEQLCYRSLERERAQAASAPPQDHTGGGRSGGGRLGAAAATAAAWAVPQHPVYLSPAVGAGLAVLPPLLLLLLLCAARCGRPGDVLRVLILCWATLGAASFLLRWHVITIVVEHEGQELALTIYQHLTTGGSVHAQLAAAFPAAVASGRPVGLADSAHSAVLPLSYLTSPEVLPQLQQPPGAPHRRYALRLAPAAPHSPFGATPVLDARELHAAAAVSARGSSGLAASIGRQLATQGFLRLRLPQAERGQQAYTAAGELFALDPAEKLALSSRLWQPAPARQCSCRGYCRQGCGREYWELRRPRRDSLRSVAAAVTDPRSAAWPPANASSTGRLGLEMDTAARAAASELEQTANAALLLLLESMVGPDAARSEMDRLLLAGSAAYDARAPAAVGEVDTTLWRVHRYSKQGCGGDESRVAQAAHVDLGLLTATTRGTAAGLELLLPAGDGGVGWVLAEALMESDELLLFVRPAALC